MKTRLVKNIYFEQSNLLFLHTLRIGTNKNGNFSLAVLSTPQANFQIQRQTPYFANIMHAPIYSKMAPVRTTRTATTHGPTGGKGADEAQQPHTHTQ